MNDYYSFVFLVYLLMTSVFITTCSAAVEVEESVVPEFTLLSGTEPVCKAYLHRFNNNKGRSKINELLLQKKIT